MSFQNFDVNTLFDNYRNAVTPLLNAQQEGLKSVERFANYQYSVAGDYMQFALSQAKAVLGAKSPAELIAKQSELNTKLADSLRGRVQELSSIASDAQSQLNKMYTDATAKIAEVTKEVTKKAA